MERYRHGDPGALLAARAEGWSREELRSYLRALDAPVPVTHVPPADPLADPPAGAQPKLQGYAATMRAAEQHVHELLNTPQPDADLEGVVGYALAELGLMREVLLTPYRA
jgi:hypothetical protein